MYETQTRRSHSTQPSYSAGVIQIQDSPGCISVQDSPVVETTLLQVMSPRDRENAGPFSSTSLEGASAPTRGSRLAEELSSARPSIVPYSEINFIRHDPSQMVHNVIDIPVPDSQNESTVHAVGQTVNFREVTQTLRVREASIGVPTPLEPSSIGVSTPLEHPDSRNVRRRFRSSSPNARSTSSTTRGQLCETPTRHTLRRELGQRDTVINELRGQLANFQNQAQQTFQTQQLNMALVQQRLETRESQDSQRETQFQMLQKQEENAREQALLLQQQVVSATDRVSTSDNLVRQSQIKLQEVEQEAYDRMRKLESERESLVQDNRELSNVRDQLQFLQTDSSRPRQFSPALPDNYVVSKPNPPPPMSPTLSDQFMSPSETRGQPVSSQSPGASLAADIEMIMEDSPYLGREARTLDSKKSVRRALSWDDKVTVCDIPSYTAGGAVDVEESSSSSSCLVRAEPSARLPLSGTQSMEALQKDLDEKRKELEKLKAELKESQDSHEQQMHHAQSQIQKLLRSPRSAPAGVENFHIASTDEEEGDDDYEEDFQDAKDTEDATPVQKTQDETQKAAFGSGGAVSTAPVQPLGRKVVPTIPSLPLPLGTTSVNNQSTQPEISDAGGKQWKFQSVLDNLIQEQP